MRDRLQSTNILELFRAYEAKLLMGPKWLGAPGGFQGQMGQDDILFDGDEEASLDEPSSGSLSSGSGLRWNLGRIRAWLQPAKWFMARATDPPSLELYIEPGIAYWGGTSASPLVWLGGTSGSFQPNAGPNPRIDIVYIDANTGNPTITQGTPGSPPVAPWPVSGSPLPVAEVYIRASSGSIFNKISSGSASDSYIYRDVRPFVAAGFAGGAGAGVSDHGLLSGLLDDDHPQYIKDSEYTAKGDLLVGTGSGTFQILSVGLDGEFITADSSAVTGLDWVPISGQDTCLIGWTFHGTLATGTGVGEAIRPPSSGSIIRTIAVVKTTGSSGSTIVDINKNATTIFTDQGKRLMVVAGGGDYDSSIPDVRSFSQYDKFSLDIDSVADGALTMWVALLIAQGPVGGAGSLAGGVYSVTAESPTASEDICIGFTFCDITIEEIQAVVKGSSPSITIDPYHTQDRSGGGTNNDILASATAITNTTTGQNLTSFDDPTIPADSWIILKTTAKSGTVDELVVTMRYTVD